MVVYDDWNALAAARCWWLLRSAGVRDVRVLDGGWSAWLRAGLPSETGEQAPAPGTVTLTPADPGRTVDADAAAAVAADPGGLSRTPAGGRAQPSSGCRSRKSRISGTSSVALSSST